MFAGPRPYTAGVPISTLDGVLASAELWRPDPARMVAGWEDAYPFCAAVCSTDAGLTFCRRCPEVVVRSVRSTGRIARGHCPAGVRLLAFGSDSPDDPDVFVLRIAPPTPKQAAAVTPVVRVPASSLRRAARETPPANGREVLRAVHTLRSRGGRLDWQVAQRTRSADRQRAASATLAQFIVATEEFHGLYREAIRQRGHLKRAQRLADRLARDAVLVRERERARIALQIHDTAAQSLVSAVRFLDAAADQQGAGAAAKGRTARGATPEGLAVPGASDATDHLGLAQGRLRTAIGELRAILEELIPPGLKLGLDQAIRYRHRDLLVEVGMTGIVEGGLPRLEPWAEQVIFGMVSEAMTNAARHSGGRSLRVECRTVRDRVVIVVLDDGRGLARVRVPSAEIRGPEMRDGQAPGGHVGSEHERGGLGLAGLVQQARWLGGTTLVRDRSGGGTEVRISVPRARYQVGPLPSDEITPGGQA